MSLGDAPDILTVPEVALLLRIGRNQAYELVRSGRLRCVRFGIRTIRIPKPALVEFLGEDVEPSENAPVQEGAFSETFLEHEDLP